MGPYPHNPHYPTYKRKQAGHTRYRKDRYFLIPTIPTIPTYKRKQAGHTWYRKDRYCLIPTIPTIPTYKRKQVIPGTGKIAIPVSPQSPLSPPIKESRSYQVHEGYND